MMPAAFTQDINRSAAKKPFGTDGDLAVCDQPVIKVLADICRVALTDGRAGCAARSASLAAARQRPDELAALLNRTRMWSAFRQGFERAGGVLPAPLAAQMHAARARAMIANGRVFSLARIAADTLGRSGIAAVAFKGPFQHRALHGDPFFYRSNDLDLLVSRQDFAAALSALEAEGFVRKQETSSWWTRALGEVHLNHPDGGVIDLHHRLQQPGCPPPRDLSHFLRATSHEAMGGVAIAVPTPAQALLICTMNFAKEFTHRHLSARYAFGVAAGVLQLSESERREFAELAVRQGLAGTVVTSLQLVEVLFRVDLPPLALPGARPLPDWSVRSALLAMVFDPDGAATRWPRRRSILWAMCGGHSAAMQAATFLREAARVGAGEGLRRISGA